MASKVPMFGAWEGGENFTVFFDTARRMKMNGAMINPNDPEQYANMFPQNNGASVQPSPSCKSSESQGKQSKVPEFGAWDNGGNVGYTACFDSAIKTKNVGAQNSENGSQIRPPTTNPEPKEARTKVPSFGAWEDGQDLSYTVCFEKIAKTNHGPTGSVEPEPPVRRDGGERARRGFGASTNGQSNEHMGHIRNASQRSVASMTGSETHQRPGRPTPGGRTTLQSRGKPQSKVDHRGSQNPEKGATIPPFGVWHSDPSRVEDFTGTFRRAIEERKTPLNKNYHQSQGYKQERKKRSCFSCFG